MKKIVTLLIAALCTYAGIAQTRTVTGKVTDTAGTAISDASVTVKGTSIATKTDAQGNFSLNAPSSATTLVVSSLNYGNKEVPISDYVDVSLTATSANLNEVVVVAYGTQRKTNVTGSIATIGSKAFDQIPVASFDNLLQGQAPGIQVTGVNGQPGAGAYIRIRGVGSLSAGQDPLYVVDGVPTTSLDLINPNDIAEISVLKDASAVSIYGSRGSNGVVLVTTKKGKGGRPLLTYRFQIGQKSKTPDHFDLMNAAEKLQYEYDVEYENSYVSDIIAEKGLSGDLFSISDADRQSVWNELIAKQVDWKKLIFRDANLHSHELSLSGSTDKISYFFSGNVYNEEGIVTGSNYKKYSSHLSVDYKPQEWVKLGTDVVIGYTEDNLIRDRYNAQNPVYAAYAYNPYEQPKNPDGSWNYTSQGFNVLEAIENNPENRSNLGTLATIYLDVHPIKDITVRSQFGINYINYQREYFIKPASILDSYVGDPSAPGSKTDNGSYDFTRIWTNTATWNHSFNNLHNVDVLIGTEFNDDQFKSYSLSSKGYPSANVSTQDNGATPTATSTSKSAWSLFSLFSRARYNFDEKYFIEGSIRRDGSSRFGVNNKYGNFWSASGAWAISRENFLKNVKAIDLLKLRASVGTAGNFNIGNYQSYGLYGYINYNGQTASAPSQVANPDLTWEKNLNYNFGFDFAALSNRLTGTVEYYGRTTSGLLANVPKSLTTGFASRLENVGELKNKGVEVTVGYDIIRAKKLRWNLTGSFTTNKNKITKLYSGTDSLPIGYYTQYKVGEPINVYYLNKWGGVNTETGAPQYYDRSGKITDAYSANDAVFLSGKSPDPRFYGSLISSLNYNRFNFSFTFYYSTGGYTYNQVYNDLISDGQNYYQNQAKDALNYWKKSGDNTPNPNPISANYTVYTTDRFLEKSDFVRLRNVTLSYATPVRITPKFSLANVRIYAQGQNLLTFTKFHGDPEVGLGSGEQDYNRPGEYTLYSYPQTRSYTVGIDVSF